jgi:hypothetical protein
VLTAAVIGVSIWFALSPHAWRSFEDRNGPVRAVITFVLAAAITVLGLRRTAAAGILLLAVGVIPVAVSSLGSFAGFASLSVVSAAPVIAGVLYPGLRSAVRTAVSAARQYRHRRFGTAEGGLTVTNERNGRLRLPEPATFAEKLSALCISGPPCGTSTWSASIPRQERAGVAVRREGRQAPGTLAPAA